MQLRPFVYEDFDEVIELFVKNYDEAVQYELPEELRKEFRSGYPRESDLKTYLENDKKHLFVLEDSELILGTIGLLEPEDPISEIF